MGETDNSTSTRGKIVSNELFNESERELIEAAKMILSDGVRRLSERSGLFPTTLTKTPADRRDITEARAALVDTLVALYGPLRHEVASACLVDAQGRLITIRDFPRGKATHCEVSPLILAEYVIQSGACAVILVHNHPSGDNSPSSQDVAMTAKFREWLAFMDVQLIDHLVISCDGAASILGGF